MITFVADSYMVRGPKQTDGTYTISFTTGEYMQKNVAEIIQQLPPMTAIEVTLKVYEG